MHNVIYVCITCKHVMTTVVDMSYAQYYILNTTGSLVPFS